MRVALIHDYLNQWGGAERVLAAIAELYPEAPIYTAIYDPKVLQKFPISNFQFPNESKIQNPQPKAGRPLAEKSKTLRLAQIKVPPISQIPLISRFYKYFSFFYPLVFESFDLREFDLIISSSSNFAKGVITRPGQVHICYCHTPPRFLYHYATEGNFRRHWFWGKFLPPLDNYLRIWDWCAAQRVDYFVANSKTTARRIKKFYGREARVIYPPVGDWQVPPAIRSPERSRGAVYPAVGGTGGTCVDYFLTVSRLSRYKNIDIIIKVCSELKLNLIVVGEGPERKNLEKIAGEAVKLVGRVSDEVLAEYYRSCQAVICAASDEDFGIVSVEAMGFGKPVVALRAGGYQETVLEGKTGEFFSAPTVASLKNVLAGFEADRYHPEDCQTQAQKFSKERFQKEFKGLVEQVVIPRS